MEECCTICADPLQFCAFGPCGHDTICSKCVTRMRLMQNSRSCVICKSDAPHVFVTRYMDEHTKKIPPSAWPGLIKAADAPPPRSVFLLKSITALFDDEEHFKTVKAACSLSHPRLTAAINGAKLTIRNIGDLKRIVKTKLGLHFCDLCIEHRQIFTSEQLLYTKAELEEHERRGDREGPLAEAQFKGHPRCNFCKSHHYDDTKLYTHMEQDHFHCFLCRKRNPEKYKYYASYEELDKHFAADHYPCPYARCTEDKFVVFDDEQELRRHVVSEHQDEANLSKADRKQAMTMPTGFSFAGSRVGHGHGHSYNGEADVTQTVERPGIIIGGGGAGGPVSIRQQQQRDRMRGAGRGGGGGASTSQPPPSHAAGAASYGDGGRGDASQGAGARNGGVALDAEDHFPGLAPSTGPAMGMHNWTGRTVRVMTASSFPALSGGDGLSKGAKKKLKAKARRGDGFGDAGDLPPAHIMALGDPDAPANWDNCSISHNDSDYDDTATRHAAGGVQDSRRSASAAARTSAAARVSAAARASTHTPAQQAQQRPQQAQQPAQQQAQQRSQQVQQQPQRRATPVANAFEALDTADERAALTAQFRTSITASAAAAAAAARDDYPSLGGQTAAREAYPLLSGQTATREATREAYPSLGGPTNQSQPAAQQHAAAREDYPSLGGNANPSQHAAAQAAAQAAAREEQSPLNGKAKRNGSASRGRPLPPPSTFRVPDFSAAAAASSARTANALPGVSAHLPHAASAPALNDFPSLAPPPATAAKSSIPAQHTSGGGGGSNSTAQQQLQSAKGAGGRAPVPTRAPAARPAVHVASINDFPTLSMRGTGGEAAQRAGSARGVSARASTPDPAPPPNSTGGISDELRADNEQLIARIKAKLSAADFATFRTKIGDFMAGKVSARAFHSVIERLGLQAEVGIMAALCPDLERSDQLLAVHTTYLASASQGNTSARPSDEWVPPEAVRAATAAAAGRSSWTCAVCTLRNAPGADNCQACNTSRMVAAAMSAAEDAQESVAAGARAAVQSGKKGKKKGARVSIHDLNAVHPQNVWTQQRP